MVKKRWVWLYFNRFNVSVWYELHDSRHFNRRTIAPEHDV
ncbi:hypothetical protein CKA32_000342 [Geitlerinema sp. FC II]|nr:hypothetical protein CKA32_000342 [Geitlerinema sp. FC II]